MLKKTLKFNLGAGYWQYWFYDKETKKALTSVSLIELYSNQSEMEIEVPDYLIDNTNLALYVDRVK